MCIRDRLVNAYTDFADFIAGLFGNRQHTGMFKHKCLPILVGIRGVLDTVSYTHLDVYKRQTKYWLSCNLGHTGR